VPSFTNDVVPVLTRYGCNQGACHGKGSGQNGFRLSLRGYAPELDHEWITREFMGRRISRTDPASSTLLRKAAGLATHEGGKLFDVGSKPYRTLLEWVSAGTPGPRKDDPGITGLKITPAAVAGKPGMDVGLKVEASYSDGSTRDVTWLAKFEAGDAGQAEVNAAGRLRVRRHGESSVRAAFQGQVAVALVTAPFTHAVDAKRYEKKNNAIDGPVMAKLKALNIEPSDGCTDAEFLRRAVLDTIGVLPTPDEVRAFLADTRADKRAKLVEEILKRPEFADHWALFYGDLFQNRRERDHDVRGVKGVRAFHAWLRKQAAANRPWDQLARDVLLASGRSDEHPAVGYYVVTVGEHGDPVRSEVADSVAQAFLGTRIGCARCHNHPLEKYTQNDFYHFAAFFSRVKLDRQEPKKGPTTLRVAGTEGKEPHLAKEKVGTRQPRTNEFLVPRPLDRSAVGEIKPGDDPRVPLARWVTDPRNEYFSGAMVNRVWRHFMGVGLVEPVDDLRPSNPPSNPELWAVLNREFVSSKFDLKHLMRLILNSRVYQLSAATRPANAADARFYSHYYARRLPAEAMLDALSSATGVPDSFPGYPLGTRAGQLPDPSLASRFLQMFGRSDRVTACACERSGEVTLRQLLHLQNGENVLRKIRDGEGRLAKLLKAKKSDDEVIEELFLATLSRRPTAAQSAAAKKDIAEDGREAVLQDLLWALVNSKEFLFNY
jgi:hypothetical protein